MANLSAFYTSKAWINLVSRLKLERVNKSGDLLCEYCHKPIVAKYDCIGHHVIPLDETNVHDANIALNPSNIQLVHHACHNAIHSRFGYERRTVYLVYGSPCAGKTTWTLNTMGHEDIMLDIDRLWSAICVGGKPDRLKSNVFGLRDCLLDQIKTRRGKWRNAYIIGGYPLLMERQRICNILGAEPIYIDCEKETCLERSQEKGIDYKKFVLDWWERYQPDPTDTRPPGASGGVPEETARRA